MGLGPWKSGRFLYFSEDVIVGPGKQSETTSAKLERRRPELQFTKSKNIIRLDETN